MRALPMLLLLAVPVALAGESEGTDPEGDEAFVDPALAGTCRDPAVDITRLALASDGETLEVRLVVRDLDARPSCGPADMPRRELERGFVTAPAGTVELRFYDYTFNFWDMHGSVGTTRREMCGFLGLYEFYPNGHAWWASRCIGDIRHEGDAVVWTLPTHGVAPTYGARSFEYDLRGESLDASAHTSSQVVPGVMTGVRPLVIDPFRFADDARAAPFVV